MRLDGAHACQMRLPLRPQTSRLENPDDRARDLGADAVALDQGDSVGHSRASQKSSASAPMTLTIIKRVDSTCSSSKRTRRASVTGKRDGWPPTSRRIPSALLRTTAPE